MKNTANAEKTLKNTLKTVAICVFCAVQVFVYIFCVLLDRKIGALPAHRVEYFAVVACFAFSLLFLKKSAKSFLLCAALLLTAAADYFLVFVTRPENWYVAGVALFLATQIAHMLHIYCGKSKRANFKSLIARLCVATIGEVVGAAVLQKEFGLLPFLAIICFSLLLFNAGEAAAAARRNPLYAVGLALFVCCDVCVALSFLGASLFAVEIVQLIWIFYLPSQALIALSAAVPPRV